jgi:hypothetical protein
VVGNTDKFEMKTILPIFMLLVCFSQPVLAGGGDILIDPVGLARLLTMPYYFFAEDLEDNNKDKTIKLDLGISKCFEGSLLYYLNDSHLVGISSGDCNSQWTKGLRQERRYLTYRGYVLRKIFGEVGVGGARTAYQHRDDESASYVRTAAKLTLGLEAQADWIGFAFYGTYRYLGNGHHHSGKDDLVENQTEFEKNARNKSTDSEFGVSLTFAI